MRTLHQVLLLALGFLSCGWAAKSDSCEPYRAKYEQLSVGDDWSMISKVLGASTTPHDTVNGDTVYTYEFGGCRLTFVSDFGGRLKTKKANPSLATLSKPTSNSATTDFREPQGPLKEQVAELRAQVDGLSKMLGYISSQVSENIPNKRVSLDPTSLDKCMRLDIKNGFLLVSLRSVEPHLNGIKAVLDVGNPLTASFNGFKVSAKWGRPFDNKNWTAERYKEWQASLQTRDESFTETLNAGSLTPVQLVLPNTPTAQFGYLEISIETDSISLKRPF
jgi:hypothetical protein